MPHVLGESNNKHQDLQSRGNKFCVKYWRDGNRAMSGEGSGQTDGEGHRIPRMPGVTALHLGCISGTRAGTQRVSGFQREEAAGWILFSE